MPFTQNESPADEASPSSLPAGRKPSSRRDFWLRVALWAGGAFAVGMVCLIGTVRDAEIVGRNPGSDAVIWLILISIAGCWLAKATLSYVAASTEKMTLVEQTKYEEGVLNHWLARYSFAVGVICIAILVMPLKRPADTWILVGVIALIVVYLMRELILWLLGATLVIGGAYLVGGAIAALPVSVAIIIGAIIIAAAINDRSN